MPTTHRKILLTRTDRMGDVILSLPAAHAIKKRFPSAQITFLVAEPIAPIIRMCPWVDACITMSMSEPPRALAARLKAENFDSAACLYPRLPIARALKMAGIPIRAGTSRRWYSALFSTRVPISRAQGGHHESEYNIMILSGLGVPREVPVKPICEVPDDALGKARIILGEHGVLPEKAKYVVIHPGCGGSARNWRMEKYRALITELLARDCQVVVTGAASERPEIEHALSGISGRLSVVAGETEIETLAGILKSAAMFVGPSTGPMHLATAVGTPVTALFGPIRTTTPDRWGPLGEGNRVFTPAVPVCDCKVNACKKGDCMDLITVEEVAGWVLAPTKAQGQQT